MGDPQAHLRKNGAACVSPTQAQAPLGAASVACGSRTPGQWAAPGTFLLVTVSLRRRSSGLTCYLKPLSENS